MEIPDDKLYRIVKLTKGQFEGEYKYYWNKHIFSLLEPHRTFYQWGSPEIIKAVPGDFIEAFDGIIVPLLDVRKYTDKKNRRFHFCRFPTATTYYYFTATNELKFRQFQGNFMTAGRNSLKMNTIPGSENQKVRFVSYLVAGLHPFKAFRLAMNNNSTLPVTTLHRKVNQLVNDEIVRNEISTQLAPFMNELDQKFDDKRLVNELDMLLERSRKGSDAHRENIKFILGLLNKLPDHMKEKNKKSFKEIPETPYNEEKIPEFGKPT